MRFQFITLSLTVLFVTIIIFSTPPAYANALIAKMAHFTLKPAVEKICLKGTARKTIEYVVGHRANKDTEGKWTEYEHYYALNHAASPVHPLKTSILWHLYIQFDDENKVKKCVVEPEDIDANEETPEVTLVNDRGDELLAKKPIITPYKGDAPSFDEVFADNWKLLNFTGEFWLSEGGRNYVEPYGRGPHIDGRVLSSLEKMFHEPYLQQGIYKNPSLVAAIELRNLYTGILNRYYAMFALSTGGSELFTVNALKVMRNPQNIKFNQTTFSALKEKAKTVSNKEIFWSNIVLLIENTVGVDNLDENDHDDLKAAIEENDELSLNKFQKIHKFPKDKSSNTRYGHLNLNIHQVLKKSRELLSDLVKQDKTDNDDEIELSSVPPRLKNVTLNLEYFPNPQQLQDELNKIFPVGTVIEDIDSVLVEQVGMFRSGNLINKRHRGAERDGDDEALRYGLGSSTADNFVFYFKPLDSDEWEDAAKGWVIKAVHGNMPTKSDSKQDRMIGGGSHKGLKEIDLLTTPSTQALYPDDASVKLAKELLQYTEDMKPIDDFNEQEWDDLVKTHGESPCSSDLSYQCLMQQAFSLLNVSEGGAKHSHLSYLADIIIQHGDEKNAQALLNVWPTEDDIRTRNESLSRLVRKSDRQLSGIINLFYRKYIQLLFLAGEYDKAEGLLIKLQGEYKTGSDYGAISVLVNKSDLEQALKAAKLTLEWKRETPDPKENSSAHGHCNTYQDPKTRPAALGDLAMAYVENSDIDKAYEVAQMVKRYWENEAYGQSSYCYTNFARESFIGAMEAIFRSYARTGDKDKALSIFSELQTTLQDQTKTIRRYSKGPFERLARMAAEEGSTETLEEMAKFVEQHDEMDYPQIYNRNTNDPVALIYALAGNHQKAVDRIEGHGYLENQPPPTGLEKLMGPDDTSNEEVRLTTYLRIAEALKQVGDEKGSLLFLEKAEPYFGTRDLKRFGAADNFHDLINEANILFDLGKKNKSREVLDEVLNKFNTAISEYEYHRIARAAGPLALLYAKHENVKVVQEWGQALPMFWHGANYARIGKMLVKQNRLNELDLYMDEMARVLSTDQQPSINWTHFTNALIDAEMYDTYLRFLDMVNEGAQEDKKKQWKQVGLVIDPRTKDRPKYPDAKKQIWLMRWLLLGRLSGENVPQDVLDKVWPRFVSNCLSYGHILPSSYYGQRSKPDAKESMASCYVSLVKGVDEYERFQVN